MAQSVDEAFRVLRIMIGGLIAGLLAFAAVAAAVAGSVARPRDPELSLMMVGILGVFALGSAVGYAMQYRQLLRCLRAHATELSLLGRPPETIVEPYRRFVIVGGGLIEGPAFFSIAVYLLTNYVAALAVAGFAVVLLFIHMPSQGALQRLLEKARQF
jgi:hypothetical protein